MINELRSFPAHKRYSLLCLAVSFLVTSVLLILHFCGLHESRQARFKEQSEETTKLKGIVHQKLKTLENVSTQLAENLSNDLDVDIERELRRLKTENPELHGVGVSFIRGAYDFPPDPTYEETGLFSRSCVNDESGGLKIISVAKSYDYTSDPEKSKWFRAQIASKEPIWQEPYFGAASKAHLAEFTAPIYRGDKIIGVCSATYSVRGLDAAIAPKMKRGYCMISTPQENIVYHPNLNSKSLDSSNHGKGEGNGDSDEISETDKSGKKKTILEYFEDYTFHDKEKTDWKLAEKGATAVTHTEEDSKGERIEKDAQLALHYEKLHNGWTLFTFFANNITKGDIEGQWKRMCWIRVGIVFMLISSALFFFFKQGPDEWDMVIATSTVFFGATICTLWYAHDHPPAQDNGMPIVDKATLVHVKETHEANSEAEDPPIFITTGLFVQSIEFASANNVVITGYVWQKYDNDTERELEKGVIFPEAEDPFIEKIAYERKDVTGWYFKVNLRQNFEYDQFPMEFNDVWIRMWHKDFDKNVVLIPDLAAYKFIAPPSKPGLEKDFVLPGWRIVNSYFSIVENSYGTNFGIDDYAGQEDFPELYFNIGIKREVMSPIIKHIVPLFVVMATLFLMLIVSDKSLDEAYGFNSLAVIATATGLFFVAIFQHIDLRNNLSSSGVIYLEFLYFLCYAAILLVSFISIINVTAASAPTKKETKTSRHLHGSASAILYWPIGIVRLGGHQFLQHLRSTHGRMFKYFFWPIFTGVFWVITVIVYY